MWAERLGGVLDVAFVDEYRYNLYLVQDPAVRTVLDDQWSRIRDDNVGHLRRLVDSLPEALRGEPLYLSGRASDQIIEASEAHDAVLLATHGRSGLSHFFLGSVAERVVRGATCPVVVLRLDERQDNG
jgi:nucleotide-binding universal stress UspA family protein